MDTLWNILLGLLIFALIFSALTVASIAVGRWWTFRKLRAYDATHPIQTPILVRRGVYDQDLES